MCSIDDNRLSIAVVDIEVFVSILQEVEKNEKLQLSLTTLELKNSKLQQDVAEQSHDQSHDSKPKSRDYEERIERLQVELEKKTSMLMEVRRHLHEAVERERLFDEPQLSEKYLTVVREKKALQEQVAQVSMACTITHIQCVII